MKKGPVCYIYHAIKNKRQLKLEQKERAQENQDIPFQTVIYNSR